MRVCGILLFNHYCISTIIVAMAPKLGKVVTFAGGILPIELLETLKT